MSRVKSLSTTIMFSYVIIFGAQYLIFFIALIAIIYFVSQPRARQKELIIFSVITLPIIYVVARIAGWVQYNPRPFVVGNFIPLVAHKNTNGFPSDHTLLSAAIAVIIYYFNKKLGLLLLVLAILVGLARVAAGVHHLIDIVASLIIAVIVGFLVHRLILPKLKKPGYNPTNNQ